MARTTGMTRDEIAADPSSAQAVLDGAAQAVKSPLPVAEFPPDDLVTLPGGIKHKDELIRRVVVKELTGEDEEALARAIQNPNPYHFLDTLLARGTVQLGNLSHDESQRLLPDLLVGDRDEIILGIRTATYGPTVEVFSWACPMCSGKVDKIEFSLAEDVERIRLKDPANESVFEVGLRKGASAKVRLATGAIQTATWEMADLTVPQRNDVMLSKTVETYTDAKGQVHLIPGFPSMVRQMSAPDRQTILRELSQRQPGPRYNDVRFKHEECGGEVSLALGITDLFRDLIIGLTA
jgi:hypothetical protein